MFYNKHFIDGVFTEGSGTRIEVLNPADEKPFAEIPRGNKDDVDRAVGAAKKAFPLWKAYSVAERADIVENALAFLRADDEAILQTEIRELGQPEAWTKEIHVERNFKRIENFIAIARRTPLEVALPNSTLRYEPVGVVACLTPWNYPLGQVVQKVIPALLAGNTVVLKPSQHTPLTALHFAKAFAMAGLPNGVLNVVCGSGEEVGEALASHADVRMVSFTGSTEAGKKVAKKALDGVRKIALELGGKSPAVVLEGANLEEALDAVAASCFANSGQTCAAYTRLLVPESLKEAAEQGMAERAKAWKAGKASDKDARLGPLVNRKQWEKVKGYIEEGIKEGAKLVAGAVPEGKDLVVQPVVFSDVTPDMSIVRDEIFGPVLVIQTYQTQEEAIFLANNTAYGLAGAVFGPKEEALRVAEAIEAGQITVNGGARDIEAPFGGYKESGLDREGGEAGYLAFFEMKAVFTPDGD